MDEEANNRSLCKKQKGGIHGLVIGDVFRRLVARSLAQLYATQIQAACRPWQFALPTRVGTEAVIKTLATSTELDHRQTILYVDGGWGVRPHLPHQHVARLASSPPCKLMLAVRQIVLWHPIALCVARCRRQPPHHRTNRGWRTGRSTHAALYCLHFRIFG